MKLWLKVSLLSLVMVTIAVSVCSLIMLVRSGRSNLDLAVQNTLTDQQVRSASWSNAMSNQIDKQYSETAQRSLARYLIDKFGDEKTILIADGDAVYNCTTIEPMRYLPITADTQQYIITEIDGSSILIAGSRMTIDNAEYRLYVVNDITSVYTGIERMAYQFALINLAVVLLAGAVLMLLVRLVLKPIATLNKNAGYIADGVYDQRIAIHENDEVGELAGQFNRMAEAVEAHVRELRDEADRRTLLMSALTHELKTPMTGISGNAQTLLGTKMTDEEKEDALLRIDAECNRIERLSQKMMQLIVLRQHGELTIQPVSVQTLLDGRIRASDIPSIPAIQTTQAQALEIGNELMQALGIDNVSCVAADKCWGGSFDADASGVRGIMLAAYGVTNPFRCVWRLRYTRTFNGMETTYDDNQCMPVVDPDDDKEVLPSADYESIEVYIDDTGIVGFRWASPQDIGNVVVEDSAVLPFDEILRVFSGTFLSTNTWSDVALDAQRCYEIGEIRFGYTRIREQSVYDKGLLIPAWDFYGTRVYEPGNDAGEIPCLPDRSIFTINAIDGAIIDRTQGY